MPLPASITTNLFPDFKNSFIGPFAKIIQEAQDTQDLGTTFGHSAASGILAAQSFQVSVSGEIASVDVMISKTGSPTDQVVVGIYSDNGGEPGTLLATGTPISGTALATSFKYFRSTFFLPFAPSISTTYWLHLSRSGSLDTSNYYSWWYNSAAPYANGFR